MGQGETRFKVVAHPDNERAIKVAESIVLAYLDGGITAKLSLDPGCPLGQVFTMDTLFCNRIETGPYDDA